MVGGYVMYRMTTHTENSDDANRREKQAGEQGGKKELSEKRGLEPAHAQKRPGKTEEEGGTEPLPSEKDEQGEDASALIQTG